MHHVIDLTPDWITRRAVIRNRSRAGAREIVLEADGRGGWSVGGEPLPGVHGYAYEAPAFGADFALPYDPSGLVLDYPGIAKRVR